MQRRIRPVTLQENFYGTLYPKPTERTVDVSTLSGGLNLWELDYRLDANQSPDLLNVYWKDGALSSRPGQEYIYENDESAYGDFVACYNRLFEGYAVAHKGTKIYKIDPEDGAHTEIFSGLTQTRGAGFFVFGEALYYLGGGKYVKITGAALAAAEVTPFVPTVVMNRTPAGTGGNLYQPENRIAAGKTVLFTSDGTSTTYKLPYDNLDQTPPVVRVLEYSGGVYSWVTKTITTDFTVDYTTGVVTFTTAPAQQDPEMQNNVEITCYKTDADTVGSIMNCTCVEVYGGDTQLAVVLGGAPAQPNAYFWSGNTSIGLDPSYFPFDYFNFAGSNAREAITGFGRQQNMLIIFQEHSIGKSSFEIETIDERYYLSLPYKNINTEIGCDVGNSIQLINNNLTFANTYGGVYVLADTSSANENNVKRISRNINGDGINKGLLKELRATENYKVISFDDRYRYWLIVDGHAYLWDYSIKGYTAYEENLSWFLFDNIYARGYYQVVDEHFYFLYDGSLVKFSAAYNDFGEAITRRYAFATQHFGTYEVLKDVMKVVFAVRTDTDSEMEITYRTDYETRKDKTPIQAWAWHLVPRNLAHRSLRPIPFAMTAIRIPRCFHIRHFQMILTNETVNTDMAVVSAQIIYRYVREDR